MARALELGQPIGETPLIPPREATEGKEQGIIYNPAAAKILATEYLLNKHRLFGTSSQDIYLKARQKIRERILRLIGEDHILSLESYIDINNPPILPPKPISQSEVNALLSSYKEARQNLGSNITRLSLTEAENWGYMIELGKSLINLGLKNALDEINWHTTHEARNPHCSETQ